MNRIKYQCTYCNTLYDTECCPGCGALREDAVQINDAQDIKERKKELAKVSYFDFFYRLIYTLHFFTCLSWFGICLAIPTTVMHFVSIFGMKKKGEANSKRKPVVPKYKKSIGYGIIRILDIILCMLSMVFWILEVAYMIHPFEFFGF